MASLTTGTSKGYFRPYNNVGNDYNGLSYHEMRARIFEKYFERASFGSAALSNHLGSGLERYLKAGSHGNLRQLVYRRLIDEYGSNVKIVDVHEVDGNSTFAKINGKKPDFFVMADVNGSVICFAVDSKARPVSLDGKLLYIKPEQISEETGEIIRQILGTDAVVKQGYVITGNEKLDLNTVDESLRKRIIVANISASEMVNHSDSELFWLLNDLNCRELLDTPSEFNRIGQTLAVIQESVRVALQDEKIGIVEAVEIVFSSFIKYLKIKQITADSPVGDIIGKVIDSFLFGTSQLENLMEHAILLMHLRRDNGVGEIR